MLEGISEKLIMKWGKSILAWNQLASLLDLYLAHLLGDETSHDLIPFGYKRFRDKTKELRNLGKPKYRDQEKPLADIASEINKLYRLRNTYAHCQGIPITDTDSLFAVQTNTTRKEGTMFRMEMVTPELLDKYYENVCEVATRFQNVTGEIVMQHPELGSLKGLQHTFHRELTKGISVGSLKEMQKRSQGKELTKG